MTSLEEPANRNRGIARLIKTLNRVLSKWNEQARSVRERVFFFSLLYPSRWPAYRNTNNNAGDGV